MTSHSVPPVPQKLMEMLAAYPDLIDRLQDVLVKSAERSRKASLTPFDDAISALEGRLETFASEARKELKTAEVTGEESLIGPASAKERLMSDARSKRHWIGDDAFFNYFGSDFK